MRTLQQGRHLPRVSKLRNLPSHPSKTVTSRTELHQVFLKEIAIPSIKTSARQAGEDLELFHG